MILIQGTIRIPPANLAAARPAMARMIAASRAEAGCIRYAYALDLLDEGLVHVSEAWESRAALAAHFAAPHLARWRACWPALGIGERALTLYEVAAGEPA